MHHSVAIGEFKLELQSGNAQSGSNLTFLKPCDLEIWPMTLNNNRAPLLPYFKLCASFRSHWWIQTGVTVRKRPIWIKFDDFEIWRMTLKNNTAPLLGIIKLYASFHHHMWIQAGVTVPKRLSWVVTSVTLTFDLWPWPFAWTLRWWEHSPKGVRDRWTDGQTDGQTENTICRAAWSQLKIHLCYVTFSCMWQHDIWSNEVNLQYVSL